MTAPDNKFIDLTPAAQRRHTLKAITESGPVFVSLCLEKTEGEPSSFRRANLISILKGFTQVGIDAGFGAGEAQKIALTAYNEGASLMQSRLALEPAASIHNSIDLFTKKSTPTAAGVEILELALRSPSGSVSVIDWSDIMQCALKETIRRLEAEEGITTILTALQSRQK